MKHYEHKKLDPDNLTSIMPTNRLPFRKLLIVISYFFLFKINYLCFCKFSLLVPSSCIKAGLAHGWFGRKADGPAFSLCMYWKFADPAHNKIWLAACVKKKKDLACCLHSCPCQAAVSSQPPGLLRLFLVSSSCYSCERRPGAISSLPVDSPSPLPLAPSRASEVEGGWLNRRRICIYAYLLGFG